MRLAALLAVALCGCHATRVAELEADIAHLSKEIEQTRRLVDRMRKQLDRHKRAAATDTPDHLPEDHDPDRPLPAGDPARPDVIVLSVDTLRADHLGAWGYDRDTSPFLDELARGGTRFTDAWSPAPWTLPSHATLLSGLLPPNHGAIEDTVRIGADIPLVQEAFRAHGYLTAAVTSSLFVSSRFGFDRGFDWFHDFDIHSAEANNAATVDADHVFAWARHWAQEQPAGRPIFLFVHVYDAHYAYNAPPPWNEKFDRPSEVGDAVYRDYHFYKRNPLPDDQLAHQVAQYDEEIAYLDDAFRRFLTRWRGERKAVVVVASDHGEEFGERGSWGHAHTLFPEQLHVPWIVHGPGIPARRIDGRVGLEDVAPTVAGLAGVPFPEGDGVDRTDEIRRGVRRDPDRVAARFASTSRFQTLRHRWHDPPWDLTVDLAHARRALCNLAADPGCTRTAVAQDRDRSVAMFDAMMNWLGTPWEARREGTVQVEGGVIFDAEHKRRERSLAVTPGDRFAVFPLDARVRFQGPHGQSGGPWAAVGGELPGPQGALAFHGRRPAGDTAVDLTASEREMLEELGYLQEH